MSMIALRVTIVTGASGALGGAIVDRCQAEGHRVIALTRSASSEVSVERVSDRLLRLATPGGEVRALETGLARAESELGPCTGAVLTAGAWRGGHDFVSAEAAADYDPVMEANLGSANVALRAILPGMVARRSGSVVLVGSRAAERPFAAAGDAAYAAAKAALLALGQAVAAEVLDHGVRVNSVLPSTIDTEANRRAMPKADHARWVGTDSLADVVLFLLSEQARDISGAAIPVYGKAGI